MHDILLIVGLYPRNTLATFSTVAIKLPNKYPISSVKRRSSIYASAKPNLIYPRYPNAKQIYTQLIHIASSAYSLEADRHRISAQQDTRGIETGHCKAPGEGDRRRVLAAEAPDRELGMGRGRRFASAVVGLGLAGRRAIVA
jgi:hypothetical protein